VSGKKPEILKKSEVFFDPPAEWLFASFSNMVKPGQDKFLSEHSQDPVQTPDGGSLGLWGVILSFLQFCIPSANQHLEQQVNSRHMCI